MRPGDIFCYNDAYGSEGAVSHMPDMVFVAPVFYQGEVCAFCIAFDPGAPNAGDNHRWFAERYESFVYLDRIAIDSNHQNRGLGALLYQSVERHMLASADHSLLCCEVNLEPPNPGSLRFHHRIGFIEVGQTIPGYANYRVSYLSKSVSEL
jgi:predicted GNAT superfamily acetyltransferase